MASQLLSLIESSCFHYVSRLHCYHVAVLHELLCFCVAELQKNYSALVDLSDAFDLGEDPVSMNLRSILQVGF